MLALLVIIPTFIALLIFSLHRFTYKITKNYFFLATIGLFTFLYFLICRYIPDLSYFIHHKSQLSQYSLSFYYSKTLLLDMCPLLTVLISLSLIFDKTKNIAKCLAPVGLIGAIVTLYGALIFDDPTNEIMSWDIFVKYLFLGLGENRLYFMMHVMLLLISLLAILNAKQYSHWSIVGTILFYIGFVIYALTLSSTLNITNNVSGLVVGDWYGGDFYHEYGNVYDFFPIAFPGIVIFWYFVVAVVNFLICILKNLFTTDLFKINKLFTPFYSKFHHLSRIYKIFDTIDHYLSLIFFKKM